MKNEDYISLETFIKKNHPLFTNANEIILKDRSINFYDIVLRKMYFALRRVKERSKC